MHLLVPYLRPSNYVPPARWVRKFLDRRVQSNSKIGGLSQCRGRILRRVRRARARARCATTITSQIVTFKRYVRRSLMNTGRPHAGRSGHNYMLEGNKFWIARVYNTVSVYVCVHKNAMVDNEIGVRQETSSSDIFVHELAMEFRTDCVVDEVFSWTERNTLKRLNSQAS